MQSLKDVKDIFMYEETYVLKVARKLVHCFGTVTNALAGQWPCSNIKKTLKGTQGGLMGAYYVY